jgi:hypothetical protein
VIYIDLHTTSYLKIASILSVNHGVTLIIQRQTSCGMVDTTEKLFKELWVLNRILDYTLARVEIEIEGPS